MRPRAALRLGLRWFIPVRWCAAVSQAVATVTIGLATGAFPIAPALATIVPTILTNFAISRGDSAPDENRVLGLLLLDVVLLSVWLVLAGGPSNPWSALYLVEVTLGAFMLGEARPWLVTAAAAIGYGSTYVLTGESDAHAHGGGSFDSHLEGMYVAYVVASVLVTFFVSRMAETLLEHETALVTERERAARIERVAALTTLAAGAAHELGTPLATIAVAAKELERELTQDPRWGEAALALVDDAKLVRDEVQRCRSILDRMAIRAGQLVGSAPARFDLGSIPALLLRSLGEARFARVELAIDEGIVVLPEHAIATIVENLVRNALDATPATPTTPTTPTSLPGAIRLAVRRTDRDLTITTTDSGSGMDEATRTRAFDPFFTTKEAGSGMGLGLFLVRSLASELGGTVEIDSEIGRGTTVVVHLPLEAQ